LREACEAERREIIADYGEKYRVLSPLYYEKRWFLDFAEARNCDILLSNQNIDGYGSNRYRFNCILYKKADVL
jgi:hypothetical protein